MMTPAQINKRYAGGYRLVTFLNVFSYIVLALGVLGCAGGFYTASQTSHFESTLFVAAFGTLGAGLLGAVFFQGCSSVLKAIIDTAFAAMIPLNSPEGYLISQEVYQAQSIPPVYGYPVAPAYGYPVAPIDPTYGHQVPPAYMA